MEPRYRRLYGLDVSYAAGGGASLVVPLHALSLGGGAETVLAAGTTGSV